MKSVSVSKFKATCLEWIRLVKLTGQPVLITKRGEPIAQLVPPPEPPFIEGWLGSERMTGRIVGDILAPLEEPWEAPESDGTPA